MLTRFPQCLGRWESYSSAGLSGSMFFRSSSKRYLLKSLGRAFENRFLHEHFLPRYFEFAKAHPDSLIHKIYDVLYSMERRFGEYLRLSPNHYIVIENIAYGKRDDWEIFDLKPTNYHTSSHFATSFPMASTYPAQQTSSPRQG
ncbi:uncharacterized protein B0H18DRAFT_986249, partial [Fomitopsis serialis]|uniref:uncharacterized protein n=1 Tax=Fomitopsis serialis TaxID=139415 RepID=UPI0020074E77